MFILPNGPNELDDVTRSSKEHPFGSGLIREEVVQIAVKVVIHVNGVIGSKAITVTSRGFLALLPPLSQCGDVIAHSRGGNKPIATRPIHGKPSSMELMGVCSVQGDQRHK